MKKVHLFILIVLLASNLFSQVPQAFRYQAVIRSNSGQPLLNQQVGMSLQLHKDSSTGSIVYAETQTPTSNEFGVISINVGEGNVTNGSLSSIDWSMGPYFLETLVDPSGGSSYISMGTTQLLPVPYALYSAKSHSADQFIVEGNSSIPSDSALFVVKDKLGQPVFTVYETGVEVSYNLSPTSKGSKTGFVVGGRNNSKGSIENIMNISTDSVRIYIDSTYSKGAKGGFTVGGRNSSKGSGDDYFSITNNASSQIINPSKPTILWYPSKNSFLVGQVLIEAPDSVGKNSFSTGFESKAVGNWSQALGYQAIARGDYSTAIGNSALASGVNSFALGHSAGATNVNSYAFGNGAIASGPGSYAFGSNGLVYGTSDQFTDNFTLASGEHAFALGLGATATGPGSTAIGVNSLSSGWGSVAIGASDTALSVAGTALGYACKAIDNHSNVAMGEYSTATGYAAVAAGWWTISSGQFSVALGCAAKAYSDASLSAGYFTTTNAPYCTAIGRGNLGLTNSLFEVGNGSFTDWNPGYPKYNAFTILNNGYVGINTSSPAFILDVKGRARILGDGSNTAGFWLSNLAGSSDLAFIGMPDDSHVGLYGVYCGWGLTMDVSSGKIGLGTISPSSNLELKITGYDGYAGIAFNNQNTNGKYLTINQGTAGKLAFTLPGVIDLLGLDFINNRVGIGTLSPNYPLQLSGGAYCTGTTWTNVSDKNLKENFEPLNGEKILELIAELPVMQWNYKSDKSDIKHIGPVAQDFHAIFGLGDDDKSISTIDPAGIALAAIKELNLQNKSLKEQTIEQENDILKQQKQIELQNSAITQLQKKVEELDQILKAK